MPTYEKESMLSELRSLVGELGNVIDQGDTLLGMMPSRNSLYDAYRNENAEVDVVESYKAERDEYNKWSLYVKRGASWVKVK